MSELATSSDVPCVVPADVPSDPTPSTADTLPASGTTHPSSPDPTASAQLKASKAKKAPKCTCDLVCTVSEVKKNGDNFGRLFYGCSKNAEEQCDFFKWATPAKDQDTKIKCKCKKMAAYMKVGEGKPTAGCFFYGCEERKCDFFKWAPKDECKAKDIQQMEFNKKRKFSSSRCKHGLDMVELKSKKPGPNQGRIFYACQLRKSEQCDSFEWSR